MRVSLISEISPDPVARLFLAGRRRVGGWACKPCAHFFGDALDIAAGGGRLVHVVGGGQFAVELSVFLGGEVGTAGTGEQGDGVHGDWELEIGILNRWG